MNQVLGRWWSVETPELLAQLKTDPSGLTQEQASARQGRVHKKNNPSPSAKIVRQLLSQFNNPIILLLMATATLSYLLEDRTNAVIIFVILIASGLLGFYQEYSAANAVRKLLALIRSHSDLLRDGREVSLPLDRIVPGDVVLLRAGAIVPGDCRLLDSRELFVNESALTGESFPVEKLPGVVPFGSPVHLRSNCVFLGTHVVSGQATAVVVTTGSETHFGTISLALKTHRDSTGFERGLQRFGNLLILITACLVLAVFAASLLLQRPVMESFLFALALAVGMTPQLLPAITSVVLARGAKRMAQAQVIVKQLLAIDNLGSMDVLCMDKTGTLTQGTIHVDAAVDAAGNDSARVRMLATLNARLQTGFINPIDTALCESTNALPADAEKKDELPYDFHRRRLSVLVHCPSWSPQPLAICKGSAKSILEICDRVDVSDDSAIERRCGSIEAWRHRLEKMLEDWGENGYRVLAVAYRPHADPNLDRSGEQAMILAGFLRLSDPPRSDAASSLANLQSLGVHLKILTGDSAAVAKSVAQSSGIPHPRILTGEQLRHTDPASLPSTVDSTDVFAEIAPEQKQQLVTALRRSHHVVGFLGDGINDAPALHAADIGISVSNAVPVAKEAAQVVILQPGLDVLARGVVEGRKTLSNTMKYIYVAISANFGYMLSMAIASLFLPFLPLLPIQILLINLLADFPAMALATDAVDEELVATPRRWDLKSIVRFMLLFGLTGTLFDLTTFAILLQYFRASEEVFRTGWFLVSIMTGLGIILAVRTRRPLIRSRPGPWLLTAVLGVTAVVWILPFTPVAPVFSLVVPTWPLVGMVLAISAAYVATLELGKWLTFRNEASRRSPARPTSPHQTPASRDQRN